MKLACRTSLAAVMLCAAPYLFAARAADVSATPVAPDWAQPGSATHVQVAPPPDFHRPSANFDAPIGIFQGQSDIGSALVPGSASYDAGTQQYTINSAGYNVWYARDEFRYLWKKMSGDVSLAADIAYPNPIGYGDRKALLIIRQDLDDNSKEAMVAMHGTGVVHLAQRAGEGRRRSKKISHPRLANLPQRPRRYRHCQSPSASASRSAATPSRSSQPGRRTDAPDRPRSIKLHFDAPFYVGIGFCSHLPTTSDTAVLSDVVLENAAGKVH